MSRALASPPRRTGVRESVKCLSVEREGGRSQKPALSLDLRGAVPPEGRGQSVNRRSPSELLCSELGGRARDHPRLRGSLR